MSDRPANPGNSLCENEWRRWKKVYHIMETYMQVGSVSVCAAAVKARIHGLHDVKKSVKSLNGVKSTT